MTTESNMYVWVWEQYTKEITNPPIPFAKWFSNKLKIYEQQKEAMTVLVNTVQNQAQAINEFEEKVQQLSFSISMYRNKEHQYQNRINDLVVDIEEKEALIKNFLIHRDRVTIEALRSLYKLAITRADEFEKSRDNRPQEGWDIAASVLC